MVTDSRPVVLCLRKESGEGITLHLSPSVDSIYGNDYSSSPNELTTMVLTIWPANPSKEARSPLSRAFFRFLFVLIVPLSFKQCCHGLFPEWHLPIGAMLHSLYQLDLFELVDRSHLR